MKRLRFLFLLFAIVGCSQQPEALQSTASINVDSLTSVFVSGWNNKDSAAIMNTIAEDAIIMNDTLMHKGKKAIADNWVGGGVRVITNIKTSSVKSGSDGSIAYEGGTYTLDVTPPGSTTLKEKGNYTMVWTKQQDGNWKLTLMLIDDVTKVPDIQK